MKKHKIFFLILFSLVLFSPALSFSLDLWDDFSGSFIEPNLWKQGEYVREIKEIDVGNNKLLLKLANTNPVLITSYNNTANNELFFSDPSSVNSIQADVAILKNNITNTAYTRARLLGRWYNDGSGTPGSDMTGDIQAEISLRGSPTRLYARWEVSRLTNATGSTATGLGGGDFTTPITLGSTYTLFISYDSAQNKFTFRVGSEELIFGPSGLPAWVRSPNIPLKILNTRVQINNSTSSCYISAAFDNVYKNGTLYDDFSSSVIDQTKWTSYEMVREISSGKLRSKIRSSTASSLTIGSGPAFIAPNSINMIQAKVTPTIFQNGQAVYMKSRLGGRFYNDGTPGGGFIGEVGADIGIGGTGVNPVAGWVVFKFLDYDGNNVEILDSGTFTTPITLGNTYTMFIGWNGSKFTFKFEGEEAYYTPTTSINPPNKPLKEVSTQILDPQGKEATIEALFDDVMVGPTGYNNNFSGTYIDRNKWKYGELVREIDTGTQRLLSKNASPNPLVAASFPYYNNNDLGFLDPSSINSIQADVTILKNIITNTAYARARLRGYWYNDGSGTPGSDMTGDIYSEVAFVGGPSGLNAYWYVSRITNANGSITTLGSGNFTTPITLGSTYTLFISYDSAQNKFTFRLGSEECTFGPSGLPARIRDANGPYKYLNTRTEINNDISSAYISAAFDNVYKNGVLYDDFSSSVIDETKWSSYEFVSEISSGKFRSKVRSSSASTSSITSALEFLFPSSVNVIQTEVIPLIFNNPQGVLTRARINGTYYNDGTPGGGDIGDVAAHVRIGGWGTSPIAEWFVFRCTDLAWDSFDILASGVFTTPITLGETYTLFLGWNGNQFTFRINNEVAFYTPTTSINPPNNPYKAIETNIYIPSNKEATIEALFDNVIVDNIYVSLDGICNNYIPCFSSIQNGINVADPVEIIRITQETYVENVIQNTPKVLTLQGGWDTTFTAVQSNTTINGSLTISDGTLIIENIILQ